MLLSPAGRSRGRAVDEWTERARKIQPRCARGETSGSPVAGNLAEAELMQNILLEEGIPSILRRSGGFDVPDFLAAGPRDVMVPASGAETARELLASTGRPRPSGSRARRSASAAFRLAAALLVFLLVFGALTGLDLGARPERSARSERRSKPPVARAAAASVST